jgi:AAA ATPase domain
VEKNADDRRNLEALRNLIELGQGSFVFALVEFNMPRLRDMVLRSLQEALPNLHLVTVALTPPPADVRQESPTYNVFDQLDEKIRAESPQRSPDALSITGLETLFPEALEQADERQNEALIRAIQPLNLGRNILAQQHPYPVLLWLPTKAMGVFVRSAPDLNSWRSGFFSFCADIAALRKELEQEAQKVRGWLMGLWLLFSSSEKLRAEAQNLERLIADGHAIAADQGLLARLYLRLGWVRWALKAPRQASWAFTQVRQLAPEDLSLVRGAEWGERMLGLLKVRAQVSRVQVAEALHVFHGPDVVTEPAGLYGREEELRRLLEQVMAVRTRFLAVYGPSGSGKSSLLQAGLIPELDKTGHFLPVYLDRWEGINAGTTVEELTGWAIEAASGLPFDTASTLHDYLLRVSQQTAKTVVVICDEFERFFALRPRRTDREPFLKAVGACIKDARVPCTFVFALQEDSLGRLAEFGADVPEPLERRKRFYLPAVNTSDALRVLRQMATAAKRDWSNALLHRIINDLKDDERVLPLDLQLVSVALVLVDVHTEDDYVRVGKAQGLRADVLELILSGLSDAQYPVGTMKQVLAALITPAGVRLASTSMEIAQRVKLSPETAHETLERLVEAHLVRRVVSPAHDIQVTSANNVFTVRYELTHDAMMPLVQNIQG